MAESVDILEKKMLLSIEAALKGVKEALAALNSMKVAVSEVSGKSSELKKTTTELGKTLETTDKKASNLSKTLQEIGKGFNDTKKIIYEMSRAVSSVFTVGLATMGLYAEETLRIGKAMVSLRLNSLSASDSIVRLTHAYKSLGSSATISLQDAAIALSNFQSKGLAEMSLGMEAEFTKGFIGVQNSITSVLGKGEGAELFSEFLGSMSGQFSILRSSIEGDINALSKQLNDAMAQGNESAAADAAKKLQKEFLNLRRVANDGGVAANKMASSYGLFINELTSTDPITRAFVQLKGLFAVIGTKIEMVSITIQEAFGADVANIIKEVSNNIRSIKIDDVKDFIEDIRSEFGGLISTQGIISGISTAFKYMKDILLSAARTAKEFVGWFASGPMKTIASGISLAASFVKNLIEAFFELNSVVKIAAIAIAGITLTPGLVPALTTAAGLFLRISSSAAKAAFSASQLATATKLIGKAGLVGGGIGVGIAGHVGGKFAARALGAEQGGFTEGAIGVLGGAAGGALAGSAFGPLGTGIGALVGAIGSLTTTIIENNSIGKKIIEHRQQDTASLVRKMETTAKQMPNVSGFQQRQKESIELRNEQTKLGKQMQDRIDLGGSDAFVAQEIGKIQEKQNEINAKLRDLDVRKKAAGDYKEVSDYEVAPDFQKKIDVQKASGNLQQIDALTQAGKIQSYINKLKDEEAEINKKSKSEGSISTEATTKALLDVQSRMAKARADQGEFAEKLPDAMRKVEESFVGVIDKLKEFEHYSAALSSFSSGADALITSMRLLGTESTMVGESFDQFIQTRVKDQVVLSMNAMNSAKDAVRLARADLDNARATTTGDKEQDAQRINAATDYLNKALQNLATASQGLEKTFELAISPLEKQISQVKTLTDLRQKDLEISQQLYGAPGLAVDAIQSIVSLKQKELDLTNQELAVAEDLIAQARARGNNEALIGLEQRKVELQTKGKQILAEQLSLTKELRDGYLDAIKAQALGAGKFSKLLITQDANIGKGLQQRAVKENYLLGGIDNKAAKAASGRFTTQFGVMEQGGGGAYNTAEQQRIREASVKDPTARAAMQESSNRVMNIGGGSAESKLFDATMKGVDATMKGSDNIVAAINTNGGIAKYAKDTYGAAATNKMLGSTAAGSTATGAAVNALTTRRVGLGGMNPGLVAVNTLAPKQVAPATKKVPSATKPVKSETKKSWDKWTPTKIIKSAVDAGIKSLQSPPVIESATDAMGITYSGSVPQTPRIPTDPALGGRGEAISSPNTVGIGNNKIRTLTHTGTQINQTGGWQTIGEGIKKNLQIVADSIVQMSKAMQEYNNDNVTVMASARAGGSTLV